MAHDHIQFSEVLEHITGPESEWLQTAFALLRQRTTGVLQEDPPYVHRFYDESPTFNFQYKWAPIVGFRDLLFFSEEQGCPGQVAILVQAFLQARRPKEGWSLTWAEWSDKMSPGMFSGGALFVTAPFIHHVHASDWATTMRQEYERKASLPPR